MKKIFIILSLVLNSIIGSGQLTPISYNGKYVITNSEGGVDGIIMIGELIVPTPVDSFCAEADSLFVRFSEAEYNPTSGIKIAYNRAIDSLKSQGLWTKTDALYIRRCENQAASLLNIKSRSYSSTAVNTPTFTPNLYWTFNGTTQYLNTGFNPTNGINFTQNNASFIFKNANAAEVGYTIGNYTSTSSRIHTLLANVGSNGSMALNSASFTASGLGDQATDKAAWWGCTRNAADSMTLLKDIYSVKRAVASAAVQNKVLHEGHINGLTAFTNPGIECVFIGGYITQAQFLQFQVIFEQFFFDMDVLLAENVKDHGAVADGSTDDKDSIQNIIDNYNSVRIGDDRNDTFLISQALIIPSNRTVVIDGVVKIKDGSTPVTVTSDVQIGDSVINVSTSAGYVVGDHVACNANNMILEGGGIQTRRVANSGLITSKTANTITVNAPAHYFLESDSGGLLGIVGSCFYIINSENINFYGSGLIDGNKSGQYDCMPAYFGTDGTYGLGNVFTIAGITGLNIIGNPQLEIINGIQGNVSIDNHDLESSDIYIEKVYSHDAHDKNFLFYRTDNVTIIDCVATNSAYEDGFIFYAINKNATMIDCTAYNNQRVNFYFNNNENFNGNFYNLICYGGNISDVFINSPNVNIEGLTISGGYYSPDVSLRLNNLYDFCTNVNITDLNITGVTASSGIIGFLGNVDNIDIETAVINNCTGTGIYSADVYEGIPEDVLINGGGIYNHTGTAVDTVGTGITLTNFIIE